MNRVDKRWGSACRFSLRVVFNSSHRKNTKILDTLELTLGIIGSSSKAEESQRFVHDLLDIDSPSGWDNQLGDEPGVGLAWQRNWRAAAGGGGRPEPYAGGLFDV